MNRARALSIFMLIVSVVTPVWGQSMDSQLRAMFLAIDRDKNGFLSRTEYLHHYETTVAPMIDQRNAGLGAEALAKIHEENRKRFIDGPLGVGDTNNDNQLSLDEYKAYNDTL